MENIKLIQGDCLEKMKEIPSGSVDCIITDPPYGTTSCKWDSVIPFEPMWKQINRIIKPNGAICLFGSEPFSSMLRCSNLKMFKYDWIWEKNVPSGMLTAKHAPMKKHEIISIFSNGCITYNKKNFYISYNPQKIKREHAIIGRCTKNNISKLWSNDDKIRIYEYKNPISILSFYKDKNRVHPTQKPILLLEYLIKTYTQENETVLDFTMGSGSTGVACVNTNRKFIGIELDKKYYDIACERIKDVQKEKQSKLF